ncbi:MAG: hypothetical protein U0934_11665 [Pseudotabrizicola sp.]|uniref:hypothetical protein n=1 Tax=Pseudotabrizicola sp. TaxID=2939647 RepID=UPI00272FA8FA|nr:hypothetical protein [Pseudotabrizicola sp.]MDP2079642.1 hypothetical protein [Pseudotabrizicola sp.]MDZ7574595.1 hypothetical protein [Pseudotabrizicola sp.]
MMTRLIYRGFEHDGIDLRAVSSPQDLIYRGVLHSGLSEQSGHRPASVQLLYRGYLHNGTGNGAILPAARTDGPVRAGAFLTNEAVAV